MLRSRASFLVAGCVATLVLCTRVSGPNQALRATVWMIAEAGIAVALAVALGLGAAAIARPRTLRYLRQFVSRGVELTAALPMVLLCGGLCVAVPLPVPVAVAIVIGTLGGLRCVRTVATSMVDALRLEQAPRRILLVRAIRKVLPTVVPNVIEQIVGLEAAIAWLGLLDRDWAGGWGEQLGQAARQGLVLPLVVWTLATVCFAIGLKAVFWRLFSPGERRKLTIGPGAVE